MSTRDGPAQPASMLRVINRDEVERFFVLVAVTLSAVPPITQNLQRNPEETGDDDIPF